MQFLVKTISSTILGSIGWWLGDFIGTGTALLLSFVLTVVGWYGAKYLLDEYLG
jgi:hypothetical protein